MDSKIVDKYRKHRKDHPTLAASQALRWAKSPDHSEGWEEESRYADPMWTKEVDGFKIVMTVEDESIFPIPDRRGVTDYGNYIDESRSEYDYEWDGNWKKPSEFAEFTLREDTPSGKRVRHMRFSYLTIRYSGPGWVQGDMNGGYFIPDGIQEQFEWHRQHGQSRSVAMDLTREFIEDQLKMLFCSPLTNCVVHIKAYKPGVDIELGSSSTGTDVSGDDEGRAYLFDLVDECDLINEAIEEAKTAIVKITS